MPSSPRRTSLFPLRPLAALGLLCLLSSPASAGEPVPTLPLVLNDAVTVRVDADHLLQTSGLRLQGERVDGGLALLRLYMDIDRVDLPKLRGGDFGLEISNVDILTFRSDSPVTVVAEAKPALLQQLDVELGPDGALLDGLGFDSAAGFPAMLDLENYAFSMLAQESAPFDMDGVTPAPDDE